MAGRVPFYFLLLFAGTTGMLTWLAVNSGVPYGDEGWYSLCSMLFIQGQMPYADFFYTQAPSSLAVYGFFYDFFGNHIVVGRFVAASFFLVALLLGTTWSLKQAGPVAASLFIGLAGLNYFNQHMGTLVFTTAFEIFFLVVIWIALNQTHRMGGLETALSAAALLTSFRISYAPVVFFLWVYALFTIERNFLRILLLTFAPGAVLLLSFGPSLLAGGLDRFFYDTFYYHVSGAGRLEGASVSLKAKGIFLWILLKLYWPLLLSLAVAVWLQWKNIYRQSRFAVALAIAAGMTLIHLIPSTPVPKYQTAIMVFLALPVAEVIGQALQNAKGRKLLFALPFLLVILLGTRSYQFINADVKHSPLDYPRTIVKEINEVTGGREVFTLDATLQFEGLNSIPGYNMDIFTIVPTADLEMAKQYKVKNVNQILDRLNNPQTRFLALRTVHEFGLTDKLLEPILAIVNRDFAPVLMYHNYGQFDCDLVLLQRKK